MRTDRSARTLLHGLQGKLIVSCQTLPPLDRPTYIADLAAVMIENGAAGVRLNGPEHVRAARERVRAPIIGINKQRVEGFDVYITPTRASAQEVIDAGADIVALDGTDGSRPDGSSVAELIAHIHERGALVMADISTFVEGERAADTGADIVATTLSGYTPHSPQKSEPDLELISDLARRLDVPVVAEGRFNTPELVRAAFDRGAFAVVVGRAITEPSLIVQPFVRAAPEKS